MPRRKFVSIFTIHKRVRVINEADLNSNTHANTRALHVRLSGVGRDVMITLRRVLLRLDGSY